MSTPRRRLVQRRRLRREEPWTPLWLRRFLGPKRRYSKRFRRYLAIAIAVASAGAALAGWRGEEHARVAEERDRAAFDQKIALEQARSEIRVNQLLDIVSRYTQLETAASMADALVMQAGRATRAGDSADAANLQAEATAQRYLQYQLLDKLPKDALTPGGTMTSATLNTGPAAIPNCPRTNGGGSIEQQKLGKFGLELAFRTTEADLCPAEELAASKRGFSVANDQIGVAGIFILAAFLLTTAQISSRPRAVAAGVSSGALTFLLAVSLFVFWEAT